MRKFGLAFAVVLGLAAQSFASAATVSDYMDGVAANLATAVVKDEKNGNVFRDGRLELIYDNLKMAFANAGLPYNQNVPILANKEEVTGAVNGMIFISEDLLAADDDTLAFVIGHEMTHVAMRDQEHEFEALLAVAAQRNQTFTFVAAQGEGGEFTGPEQLSRLQPWSSAGLASPAIQNDMQTAQWLMFGSLRAEPAFDVPAFMQYVRSSRESEVLPKAFYQAHESRADAVGATMAQAAGYHLTKAKISALLHLSKFNPDETYDHPSADSRVEALYFLP